MSIDTAGKPPRRVRAIAYVRVSTSEQAEHGHGLEAQESAIAEYCKRENLRLVDIESVEGISGSNGLENRV